MTQAFTRSSLLLPSPARCPACDHEERRRLGPVRYGANALVADQDASALAEAVGPVDLVACAACGFEWTDPQYSMDAVIALYRRNEAPHWEADGRDWSRHIGLLAPFMAPRGSALDVGCYTGGFLEALGAGWDRHGIEPIPYAVRAARARGLRIHEGTLDSADYAPDSFNLITLWDMAEHLQRPREAFTRLAGWLRPGGIIALETGNAACRFAGWMGADWWYVALLEHCSFYTPRALGRLFEGIGLTVETIVPTHHHHRGRAKTAAQLGKAALYRSVSRASQAGRRWAAAGPASRILRRHAPCVLVRDHLFVVARRPAAL